MTALPLFASEPQAAHACVTGSRVLLIVLSLLYLLMYLPLLDQVPPIVVDEPWYANTAHNLANGRGLINTNVGQFGGDQFFLYPLVVSIAFKVGGTTLWIGRLASLLLGLLALWGWIRLCRQLGTSNWVGAAAGALFVTSNVYFVLFRRLRPEALVIVFSVWALCWFITASQTHRFKAGLMCALLVGGSALAHPNGVILAGIFFIVFGVAAFFDPRGGHRHIYGYVMGGLALVVVFLTSWALLRGQSVLDFFKEAVVDSGRLSVTQGGILSSFWTNLSTFVPAYTLGVRRAYILLFELGVLVVGLVRYRADHLTGLLSLIGLLWFLLALTILTPFVRSAFCVVLIFSLIVTARLLGVSTTVMPRRIRTALWALTLLYALNNIAGDVYLVKQNAGNTSYTELSRTLDAAVPDNAPVLTHLELWFAFQHNPIYTPYTRFASTPYAQLQGALRSGRLRYAIISAGFSEGLSPTTGEPYSLFVNPNVTFYRDVHPFLLVHGRFVALLRTHGYGDIEIWEFPHSPTSRLE